MDRKTKPQDLKGFLERICDEYVDARKPIIESSGISRGRSRTISGISEDLFAVLMKNSLDNDELHFFIDQPIRIKEKTFYPDLVITKKEEDTNYKVLYMLDLKMDVGYHRNTTKAKEMEISYRNKADELTYLCNQFKDAKVGEGKDSASKKSKTDKSARRFKFEIAPKASYDMVVITNQNAGSETLRDELLNCSHDPERNIWVLSSGEHPNEYHKPDIKPNNQDFNVLIDKIQKVINSVCCSKTRQPNQEAESNAER